MATLSRFRREDDRRSQVGAIELKIPDDLARFRLPPGVQDRLQALLDRQDEGGTLTTPERQEAEGLVTLAELLSLLRLRAERRASPRRAERERCRRTTAPADREAGGGAL